MASSKLNIKGVSLIESLVCLVIVGIGFIGVNQMITYATSSIDRSMDANKINFLSETAVEDIMGDPNNASNYSFSQQCSKNYSSTGSLAEKAKAKWSKHFMQENQLKINLFLAPINLTACCTTSSCTWPAQGGWTVL